VLSQQISVLSQQISALSQLVSVLSARLLSDQQLISVLSQQVSVISAGLGGVQIRVVATNNLVSGAVAGVLTAISGLSASVAVGGVYEVDAMLIWTAVAGNSFGFGLTFPGMVKAAGRWITNLSVPAAGGDNLVTTIAQVGWHDEAGSNSTLVSGTNPSTSTWHAEYRGLFTVSTAGVIQLATRVSAGATTIFKGSFIRAFKIG
jgi:hypothetical protein